MAYKVDFKDVSTIGLTASPAAEALAGLRANEARYFWNKYKLDFTTVPASEDPATMEWVDQILADRDLKLPWQPLEIAIPDVDGIRWVFVFYENGVEINVMYTLAEGGKRAVGIKLSDGIEVPEELADKFKFARQKSKLAGTIRGSYFVIKGSYL